MKISAISHLLRLKQLAFALAVLAVVSLAFPSVAGATSLTLTPAAWTKFPVPQGGSANAVFSLTTGGSFSGSVTMSVSGLPSGVTASWDNATITPPYGVTVSPVLTITAGTAAALGQTSMVVTATGASGVSISHSYWLVVQQVPGVTISSSPASLSMQSMGTATLNVTATPYGGVTLPAGAAGASAAIVSGLPAGVSASWGGPSISGNAVTWPLTLTGSAGAIASSGTLAVSTQVTDATTGNTYSASQAIPLNVTLTPPTLALSPGTASIPVVQGAAANGVFTISTGGSFNGNVSLAVSGLPSGVTASWSNASVTPSSGSGSSTLTLAATSAAATGSTTFTVTATGDGLTVSNNYTVQVQQAPGATAALSAGSLTMQGTGTTTVTLTATPVGGVTVSAGASGSAPAVVSGLPTGVTAAWSSPTVNSSGSVSWTLTLTGSSSAKATTGTLVLSAQVTDATSGIAYSASQSASLTVSLSNPTLSLTPAAWTKFPVSQGASAPAVFALTTGGSFTGNVTLTVAGLPTGVTASWDNNPVTTTNGTTLSPVLTLTASGSATAAQTSFTVNAAGDGLSVTHSYWLVVQQAPGMTMSLSHTGLTMESMGTATVNVTATPFGGVTVPGNLAGAAVGIVSGLPTGVTATWSSPTLSGGAVTWSLTLTGSNTAIASSGSLVLSSQITDATSGIAYSASQGIPLTVSLTTPTLAIAPTSTSVPVVQGASATDSFSITTGGSFNGNVGLAISGLPTGVTASWSSASITPVSGAGSSTLTLSATTAAVVGNTTFTVTATGDGLTVTKNYTVQVQQAPGVTLALSPTTLTMRGTGTGTITLTATPIGGVTVPANAAGSAPTLVSGLPSGITSAWSSPTINSSGSVSWTLTLTGSSSAKATTGTLAFSAQVTDATSGIAYSASQSMPLTVSLTAPTLALTPASWTKFNVVQGASAPAVFGVTTGGSFNGPVTLSVTGLPTGVTATWDNSSITPPTGTAASPVLTLTAVSTAAVGETGVTVTAAGSGLTVSHSYWVMVNQAPGMTMSLSHTNLSMASMGTTSVNVTATAVGGVTIPAGAAGTTASIVSGLPSGVTPSWSSPTISGNAATWTLTLTGSPTAIASSGPLTLASQITDATSGIAYSSTQAIPLNVTQTAPTLAFSTPAAWTKLAVEQGTSASFNFSWVTGGSFHGNVSLAIAGLPSGVTASWDNNPVNMGSGPGGGNATLTLTASPTAVTNYYAFTITASGDGLNVVGNYAVLLEPSVGMTVQLSQPVVSIQQQGTATLTVTATPRDGIQIPSTGAGASAAVVSNLPTGITASWSSPTITSAGAAVWTLTLNADTTAVPNNDPLNLAVQITDSESGMVYTASPCFNLLVTLLANVNIGSTPGLTIPSTFMGLSHEWGDSQSVMGYSSSGSNLIYRQLLQNLTAFGASPINLRIGGNSTDVSGEPVSTTVTPMVELANALGVTFEMGVNLGSDNVSLATDQATAYANQMPSGSLQAIEIGNEPDWYTLNGLRPNTYTVQDYFTEFQTWAGSVLPVLPTGVKLMGPSWAVTTTLSNISSFESQFSSDMSLVSQHYYATDPSTNPVIDFLLTPTASSTGAAQVASAVAATHALGLPFRIGETGAISGGGVQSIGQAFGSALWTIDSMFEFANVGVDGINWEATTGNYNDPFSFTRTSSHGTVTYTLNTVYPQYYGFLFFQEATQNGAQLLPVDLTTTADLKAWATVDSNGTPRLAIINKDEALTGSVAVTLPGFNHASVLRLAAPSFTSSTGVTFGGQTFDGSTDGTIQGSQTMETIDGANGVFQIPMAITSAALVIFTP